MAVCGKCNWLKKETDQRHFSRCNGVGDNREHECPAYHRATNKEAPTASTNYAKA